jgi:transposase
MAYRLLWRFRRLVTRRDTPPSSPRRHPVSVIAQHPSRWAAINSIAGKIGCTGETLRSWARRSERDQGLRAGPTTQDGERIKAVERENRELRQANEILRKASAYFAQAELDRPFKR